MQYKVARTSLAITVIIAACHTAVNIWAVPRLNQNVLPNITTEAANLLKRPLDIGGVKWLAPTGITGLTPLASVGPVSIGAGPVEVSSATIERVLVRFDPLKSLVRGKLVLTLDGKDAEVHLHQGGNYSWFGYPEDTEPSSRDFVPGLTEQNEKKKKNGGGGRGGNDGGSHSGGGGGGEREMKSRSNRNKRRKRGQQPTITQSAGISAQAPLSVSLSTSTSQHQQPVPADIDMHTSNQAMQALHSMIYQLTQDVLQNTPSSLVDEVKQAYINEYSNNNNSSSSNAEEEDDSMMSDYVFATDGPLIRTSSQEQQEQLQQQQQQTDLFRKTAQGNSGSNDIGGDSSNNGSSSSSSSSTKPGAASSEITTKAGNTDHNKGGFQNGLTRALDRLLSAAGSSLPTTNSKKNNNAKQPEREEVSALNKLEVNRDIRSALGFSSQENTIEEEAADGKRQQEDQEKQTLENVTDLATTTTTSTADIEATSIPTTLRQQTTTEVVTPTGNAALLNQDIHAMHVEGSRLYKAPDIFHPPKQQHSPVVESSMQAEEEDVDEALLGEQQKKLLSLTRKLKKSRLLEEKERQRVGVPSTIDTGRGSSVGTKPSTATPSPQQQQQSAHPSSSSLVVNTMAKKPQSPESSALNSLLAPVSGQDLLQSYKQNIKEHSAISKMIVDETSAQKKKLGSQALPWVQKGKSNTDTDNSNSTLSTRRVDRKTTQQQDVDRSHGSGRRRVSARNGDTDTQAPSSSSRSKSLADNYQFKPSGLIILKPRDVSKEGASELSFHSDAEAALNLSQRDKSTRSSSSEGKRGEEEQETTSSAKVLSLFPDNTVGSPSSPSSPLFSRNKTSSFLHPGYFGVPYGPTYTPAPPEAIIDARARQRTVGTVVKDVLRALVRHAPQVAVGGIELKGDTTLYGHIAGEAIPRKFDNVKASLSLGKDYDSLYLNITAQPRERDPASAVCTMPSPYAHRHLRDLVGVTEAIFDAERFQPDHSKTLETAAAPRSAIDTGITTLPSSSLSSSTPPQQQLSYGGQLRVEVFANQISKGAPPRGSTNADGPWSDLAIKITGKDLHTPLIERLIELPMDIYQGRVNGTLTIKSKDTASWHFPEFYGRLAVKDAEFHFWDATDDIMDADLDLLFEGKRVYLHNASGRFGEVPLTITGDLDLFPEGGEYRLSARVDPVKPVEINLLRATLGVRPTPFPVSGAIAGTLNVTGPLEKPVFSGRAVAVRPADLILADCESTQALTTIQEEASAVGAYDLVPLTSASLVFSLDTAANIMVLHEFTAQPVGGGELRGAGKMNVAPWAEQDPEAVFVKAYGTNIPAQSLLERYYQAGISQNDNSNNNNSGVSDEQSAPSAGPSAAKWPAGLVVPGPATIDATMRGSHLSPVIDVNFSVPDGNATGKIQFTREETAISMSSPQADVSASLRLNPAPFSAIKAAVTQAAATSLAKPDLTGAGMEVNMRGMDILPLLSSGDEDALRQLAARHPGQPLRLKMSGNAKINGAVTKEEDGIDKAVNSSSSNNNSWSFDGKLGLQNITLNQLKLFKKLSGNMQFSETKAGIHGRGLRADEVLDLEVDLTLFNKDAKKTRKDGSMMISAAEVALPKNTAIINEAIQQPLPPRATAEEEGQTETTPTSSPSLVNLRCGQLLIDGGMEPGGSALRLSIKNLPLDELEFGSLRGSVQEASAALDFVAAKGQGRLVVNRPRFSGLQGESLSGGFRWDRDVIRLEKAAIQQKQSRYEVQGEYTLPPGVQLPRSAVDLIMTKQQLEGGERAIGGSTTIRNTTSIGNGKQSLASGGRWRVQVNVPSADMQEILPAARLVQDATSLAPPDQTRAKEAFLDVIKTLQATAGELNTQIHKMASQIVSSIPTTATDASVSTATGGGRGSVSKYSNNELAPASASSSAPLAGFQDAEGEWSGSIQAYGGGGGATSCDFDLKGHNWKWRSSSLVSLDNVSAVGNYHSEEGLHLEEFVITSEGAKLLLQGSLFGEKQDATLRISDFPVATLRPLFRAVPALARAVPAVSAAEPPKAVASPYALGKLTNALGQASKGLTPDSSSSSSSTGGEGSPINGLLYMSGTLGGSMEQPTGEVAVRLYDAAIGTTRLSRAEALARLNDAQQLSFNVDIVPADGHSRQAGHVRAAGTLPLAALDVNDMDTATNNRNTPKQLPIDIRLAVRDSGMAVLTSLSPEVEWQGGEADITFHLYRSPSGGDGTSDSPAVTTFSGSAIVSKGTIDAPGVLKSPLTNLTATIRCEDGQLMVDRIDGKVGRRGFIRIRGGLPFRLPSSSDSGSRSGKDGSQGRYGNRNSRQKQQNYSSIGEQGAGGGAGKLTATLHALELRVPNVYSGLFDASLQVAESVECPTIGGKMTFSKGTFYLNAQAQGGSSGTQAAGDGGSSSNGNVSSSSRSSSSSSKASSSSSSSSSSSREGGAVVEGPVARTFRVLTRGAAPTALAGTDAEGDVLASKFEEAVRQEREAVEALVADAAQHNVFLDRLCISLGPDIKAVYPLVMNLSVTGQLEASGPPEPGAVSLKGVLKLSSGDVNFIATQLLLDRNHNNIVVFSDEPSGSGSSSSSIDPIVDLAFNAGDLQLTIQGRASEWQDHLQLKAFKGPGNGGTGETGTGEALDAADAAKILEERLKSAILAEDGQLALSKLAGTTVSTFLPKIETQGQVGTTKWRLMSAPAIPGLLEPSLTDPGALFGAVTFGTEMEVQFGRRLQAAMVRQLRESDVETRWTLSYELSSKLKMQFGVSSAPPYTKTLIFQFSSNEGGGNGNSNSSSVGNNNV
jgi:hypothetical protein